MVEDQDAAGQYLELSCKLSAQITDKSCHCWYGRQQVSLSFLASIELLGKCLTFLETRACSPAC